ncbi:uncharacterized protein METZ01_LOCUS324334, partial [marine metagenome]
MFMVNGLQGWNLGGALVNCKPTPRSESAPRIQKGKIRWLSINRNQPSASRLVHTRNRSQQAEGIRVMRVVIDFASLTHFNQFTGIHDIHPISITGDNT